MTAVMRFVAASCIASQRWVAPVVVFAIGIAATFAADGSPLGNAAEGAALLFPIAAWITVATLNDEDPSQRAITTAASGSRARARSAKLAVAGTVCLALTGLSILIAAVRSTNALTFGSLSAALLAHLIAATAGIALGTICAAPIVSRNGSALLTIAIVTIADLVLPKAPPEHLLLSALAGDAAPRWSLVALAAGETAVLSAGLLALSSRLARAAA